MKNDIKKGINSNASSNYPVTFNPKLSNISEKSILTYKELTELLDIEYNSGGNAKKYQLELLACYVDYLKKGTKFYIKKIHDEKTVESLLKKRNDKIARKNNGLYIKHIELILLNELSRTDGNTFSLTRKNIYKLLGMANEKYFYTNYGLATDKEIEADRIRFVKNEVPIAGNSDIDDFFLRTNDKFRKTLSDSLNSLKSRRLIDHWEEKIIVMLPELLATDNNISVYTGGTAIVANDNQTEKILQAEHEVLDELGLKKVEYVYLTKRKKEFSAKVKKIISKFGWDYYYKQIKIVYNKENAKNHIPILENEILKLKAELNNELINSLIKQVDKKQEDLDFLFEFVDDELCSSDENANTYEYIQKELIEKLIRIN